MKTRTSLILCALAVLALVAVQPAQAATLYWDLNQGTPNTAVPVTGNWDGVTVNWNDDASGGGGGTTTATTTNASDVVFSSDSIYTAGTVTVSPAQVANSVTFEDNISVTLSSGDLTLGSGANPGIYVLAGNNQANTVSTPIVLAANSTFQTLGNGGLTISGGVTGTGNLAIVNNGVGSSLSLGTVGTTPVNNVGTVTYSGTSYARTTIQAVGSNVTGITQSSNTSNLIIPNTVPVNIGGTTITNSGVQSLTFFRDNSNYAIFNGTGNLVFNNNSRYSIPLGIDLNGNKGNITVDNVGTVTNSGTGLGGTRIDAQITISVTGLIQNSATSNLYLVNVTSNPGAGAVTQANNTFTGPTSINAGILYAGYANALTSTGSITFGGGTLMYGAVSATDLSAKFTTTGTTPYSIDTNNQAITYASNLAANSTKGLNKFGPGTLTLSAANTYTGTTTIGGGTGTLERLDGGTLQVGNGTTGSLNGTTGTALTFAGTGTFNVVEPANSTQGMLALTFGAGDGTVQSTYAGTTGIDVTTLTFSSLAARAVGATGNFIASGGTNGTDNKIILLTGQATGFMNQGTFFGGGGGGGGAFAWYDTSGFVRAIVYTGSPDTGASQSAGGTSITGTHVQVTGPITAQQPTTFSTLNFNSASNFTLAGGSVTVNGILKSGNAAGGVIRGGTGIRAANNADLVIRTEGSSDTLTVTTPILANGANALAKSGAGTLKLSGANTYTGNTAINAGTLILDTPANKTYSGVIGGAGALVVTGPGTLTLTKAATFTGGLTISAGTLKLDFTDPSAPSAEMLNGVNTLTLGSAGALNVVQGGGTLLIKAKGPGITTTQNLSVKLPPVTTPGVVTNAGSHRILVDPNGGIETQVVMGQLQNVIMRNGNSERVASNGGTLLLGKSAGAGSGNVIFMYSTDGRNGLGYGGNMPARMVYTPDGGNDVDFVTGYDNTTSPYVLIPVGSVSTYAYTPLVTGTGGGGWLRLSGSDASVTLSGANCTGLKIANPDPGRSITLTGTWTPNQGIIMTGSNDFTIQGSNLGSDNNGNARAYVFQQYSTGTLTISSVLNQTTNTGHLVKSGPGRLILSGPNTFTGQTYISEGILTAGVAQNGTTSGPFGTSNTINFAGGTLQYSTANQNDYSPRFSTSAGQPISIDTFGQNVTFGTALVSAGGTLTLNDSATTKGTLTLTNANTYTGDTKVSAGTLALTGTGAIANTPTINVASLGIFDVSGVTGGYTLGASQTLKGNGTVIGPMTAAGTVAPGSSTGTLTVTGDATLNGIFSVEVEAGGASDLLAVTGNLSLGGSSVLSIVDISQLAANSYTIATYTGNLTGTFGGGTNLPGSWSVNYGTGSNSEIKVVPEPATLALMALGGLGLILSRKRR